MDDERPTSDPQGFEPTEVEADGANMRSLKVVIAGPSAVRQSIRRKLELISDDVRVVAEAPTVRAAVLLTRRFAPNAVFVAEDEGLQDPSEVVAAIRAATPQRVEVILIPAHPVEPVPPGVEVMPRSHYTQRAMLQAMNRVLSRL